jgi:serine/threonine protein kinase
MSYAAPEVVRAYEDSSKLEVSAAQDVWALGVMAYEAMVGQPSFPRHTRASVVFQCAHGTRLYPWERPGFQQPELARFSSLPACLRLVAAASSAGW